MKLFVLLLLCLFTSKVFSQIVYSCNSKYDADIKVYVADSKYDADLIVYKCQSKYDVDDNKGLWYFANSNTMQRKRSILLIQNTTLI